MEGLPPIPHLEDPWEMWPNSKPSPGPGPLILGIKCSCHSQGWEAGCLAKSPPLWASVWLSAKWEQIPVCWYQVS